MVDREKVGRPEMDIAGVRDDAHVETTQGHEAAVRRRHGLSLAPAHQGISHLTCQ